MVDTQNAPYRDMESASALASSRRGLDGVPHPCR
jgi:hypothetical protein